MTSFAKISSILLFSGFAIAHGALPATSDEAKSLRVEPLKAITLTVGGKRAIGYYANSGAEACNLTLMLADAYSDDTKDVSEPVRVNLTVRAGASAGVETFQRQALRFSCAADATSMAVKTVQSMAYNAAK